MVKTKSDCTSDDNCGSGEWERQKDLSLGLAGHQPGSRFRDTPCLEGEKAKSDRVPREHLLSFSEWGTLCFGAFSSWAVCWLLWQNTYGRQNEETADYTHIYMV